MLIRKIGVVIATLSTMIAATAVNAAVNGFYLGGQLGWGNTHQSGISSSDMSESANVPLTSSSSSNSGNTGFAGRAFGGYQFNPNWAVEAGWTQFHNMSLHGSATTSVGTTLNAQGTFKANAVDLVAKGIMPLRNGFNVFGKLGAALLIERTRITSTSGTSLTDSDLARRIFPTFGLGVGYDINQNFATDLSWQHIQKTGSSALANTDFIGIGLSYHFS